MTSTLALPGLQQAEADDREAYTFGLADKRVRRILKAVLRWSGIDGPGAPGPTEQMAYTAGLRQVGYLLVCQLRAHDPAGFDSLQAEINEDIREQIRESERQRAAAEAGEETLQ